MHAINDNGGYCAVKEKPTSQVASQCNALKVRICQKQNRSRGELVIEGTMYHGLFGEFNVSKQLFCIYNEDDDSEQMMISVLMRVER